MGFLQYLFGNRLGGNKYGNSHGNNNGGGHGNYNSGGGHRGGNNKHGGYNQGDNNEPCGQVQPSSQNSNVTQPINYAKYCPSCGTGQKSDALFCSQCGKALA